MAVDWTRVQQLNDIIAKTPVSLTTSASGAIADRNAQNWATRNAASQELDYILSGRAAGDSAITSAVGAAQSGLNAILNAGAGIKADSNAMRGQAGLVNTQAGALNNTANAIISNADAMRPLADKLGGYGDTLWGQGQTLWDQAKDTFGQAGALVSMDPNATGLAGEFLRMYGYLSPDRYVSQAASDVQGAYGNAWAQLGRQAARTGSSAGGGNRTALEKQYATSLATALAAAKTKARQTGIDQQSAYLGTMTNAANTFYNMGKDSASQAMAAQGAAGDLQKGAAGILSDIGGQYGAAGSLQNQAGGLYANAAAIFGNAAGLDMNYAKLTQDGYNSLSSAYQAAADYYLRGAELSMRGSRVGGGGGAKISSPPQQAEPATPSGGWVDLTHGHASHADGAQWVWDPNLEG